MKGNYIWSTNLMMKNSFRHIYGIFMQNELENFLIFIFLKKRP